MANTTFKTRIQNKHDTSTNWKKATNFVPLAGELIFYDDLNKIKIGDGTKKVSELDFIETTYSNFVGSGENAAAGLVPAPNTTEGNTKYLCENGTWKEIEVPSIMTYIYNTVADMITDANSLAKGDIVQTRGYYSAGDGGGAYYQIWNGTASDILSLQLKDGLAATVIGEKCKYNALQYGIKNDGVTDVTNKVNELFQIAEHDSTLYFPNGMYLFTAPIVPNRLVTILGDTSTIFKDDTWISANTSGTIFNFDASNMPNFSDYIQTTTNDDGTTTTTLLYTDSTAKTITYNDKVYKLDEDGFSFINYGQTATGRYGVNIENIFFNCNSYDATVDTSKFITNADEVFVATVTKEKINGLKLGGATSIKNCTFDGWSGCAITGWMSWNNDGYPSWTASNHIDRCYFNHCYCGIQSCIDSQFMNIRFAECYIGIINNGSANLFSNVRMDSIGKNGIKMEGAQCGSTTITNLNIDVAYGAGLILHGDNNYVQGLIGRCGGKSSGRSQTEITYDEFPDCCNVYLDDDGCEKCNSNVLHLILTYGPVYEYAEDSSASNAPAVLIGASNGSYQNNTFYITSTQTMDNSNTLFTNVLMGREGALNAPSDAGHGLFNNDVLTYNGQNYVFEEHTYYPFEADCITLNNFYMGYGRDPSARPPKRLGTMMEHYWQDRYCLGVYNKSTTQLEWIDIKNPAIDTSLHESNATASAKETGTEISILRQRIGNLESALSASNITNISYNDKWKTVGDRSGDYSFTYNFTDLDLLNNEIEVKIDLTNFTADDSPSGLFINFVNANEDYSWANSGWHLDYGGYGMFQSYVADTAQNTGALYGNNTAFDWSAPITIRINRQGFMINNIPVQVFATNKEVYYRDTMVTLISNMIAAKNYRLEIGNKAKMAITSIKVINYNMTDTSLGTDGALNENNIISVDDLKTYIGI